jgi:hypothetical protein
MKRAKRNSEDHKNVSLICALLGSLALPIFFLAVRHFHLEGEAAEWMVSLWPRSLGEVALEDRRAAANMLVAYGELAGTTMLTYSVIGWAIVLSWRFLKKRWCARSFVALGMTEAERNLSSTVAHPPLEDERRLGFPIGRGEEAGFFAAL